MWLLPFFPIDSNISHQLHLSQCPTTHKSNEDKKHPSAFRSISIHYRMYNINTIPKELIEHMFFHILAFVASSSLLESHLELVDICCKPPFICLNLLNITIVEANLISATDNIFTLKGHFTQSVSYYIWSNINLLMDDHHLLVL